MELTMEVETEGKESRGLYTNTFGINDDIALDK